MYGRFQKKQGDQAKSGIESAREEKESGQIEVSGVIRMAR
jgi:hypothetical protein